MSPSCDCFRYWPNDDEGQAPKSLEEQGRAAHHLYCPECRPETGGSDDSRATVRDAFRLDETDPPLAEDLVARLVRAMRRAAYEEQERDA